MMNNVKRRNLYGTLTSSKGLKAMLGEEEEIFEENEIEEEAERYLDDDNDADTDEDELDLDDSDDEVDSDSGNDDDFDSDNDAEEEQSSDDEWDAEDDDLLTFKYNKRKSKLSEGEYMARIGKITAEKKKGNGGEHWIKVTLPFEVKNASGVVTVPFRASMSLSPNGRLYPIVRGILGCAPEVGLSLRELQGKQVKVKIGHYVDDHGSVWEEVKSVKKVG